MKSNYLLPHNWKLPAIIIGIISICIGVFWIIVQPEWSIFETKVFSLVDDPIFGSKRYFAFISDNIFNEILGSLLILSMLIIAFSREKEEDEFISKIRLESLVWATYLNYFIVFISLWLLFGLVFYWVLVLNVITILLFFIVRFNWIMYKYKKEMKYEE